MQLKATDVPYFAGVMGDGGVGGSGPGLAVVDVVVAVVEMLP